jgi:short-subunit dehydrogenase
MATTRANGDLALVTGASSGIGEAIAVALARRKVDLVLTARREDRLRALAERLAKDHGVRAHVLPLDLGRRGGAQALYDATRAAGHEVSILVNNAGFGLYGLHWQLDPDRVEEMLELDVVALTRLTHLFVRDMVARGRGRVLQVASIGSFQPSPYYASYAAAKAYVLQFGEALHWELQSRKVGVTVTTTCPGITTSEFHDVAGHEKPKSFDLATMSAEAVAERSVRAMLRGRPLVVPGWYNRVAAVLAQLFPRRMVTESAGRMMTPRP